MVKATGDNFLTFDLTQPGFQPLTSTSITYLIMKYKINIRLLTTIRYMSNGNPPSG